MSSDLVDIMNEVSSENLREQAEKSEVLVDNFDGLCSSYIELKSQIKQLEKKIKPIETALKSGGDASSKNYQVRITNVESFRMKSVKALETEGYTKERIVEEGIGGFTTSKRMGVSKL